jgi:pyruvate dehydrogenase E1 component
MSLYRPPEDSPEMTFLRERRAALGGSLPARRREAEVQPVPEQSAFESQLKGTGDREVSTTMAFGRHFGRLLKHKDVGRYIVPIIPDETRTFGMEGMFRQIGIYAPEGQKYRPQDADQLMYYREDQKGQVLQEGISVAGAMSAGMAAASSYSVSDVPMLPFFIYYSMFGFQRIGDLCWAAGDMRARGFLIGGTSGRTTLNGEGLQHQDGHSHLLAGAIPNCHAYDPTFAYEVAVILQDGVRRMLTEQEDAYWYVTVLNENYAHPELPKGVEADIIRGMYLFRDGDDPLPEAAPGADAKSDPPGRKAPVIHESDSAPANDSAGEKPKSAAKSRANAPAKTAKPSSAGKRRKSGPRVQLLGCGAILREVISAAELLEKEFGVVADIWSCPSFNELRRDGFDVERWNRLHPLDKKPRTAHVTKCLADREGPVIAATDYVRAYADQIRAFIPSGKQYVVLGTEGFGRSDTRAHLREFFEVDRHWIAHAAVSALAAEGTLKPADAARALELWKLDPDKPNPTTV